ncbi:MAG: hypothetical protein EB075_00550 [Bacteroidetes bacterium]|nr:hypothetical protein [Bacteroidota bacterium]
MRSLFVLATLVAAGLTVVPQAYAQQARLAQFDVVTEEGAFVIQWKTQLEDEVMRFEVLRQTTFSSGQFETIGSVVAKGAGASYQHRDDNLYKFQDEQVDYRLDVVFSTGERQTVAERSVNYFPTSVRRTWGGIKAMFQ